jgi:hypothetical protein
MARNYKDHWNKAFRTNNDGTSTMYIDVQSASISSLAANTARLNPVDFMDTPLLICSSTNIPASAANSLQVVSSLAAAVKKVQLLDTTGEWIGLYTGAVATPTLVALFGPGSTRTVDIEIAAGTKISLRNMKNAAIIVGEVVINFFG